MHTMQTDLNTLTTKSHNPVTIPQPTNQYHSNHLFLFQLQIPLLQYKADQWD